MLLDVDVDSFSGATLTATDDEVLAALLKLDFDEDIDQEAEFVTLLKKGMKKLQDQSISLSPRSR